MMIFGYVRFSILLLVDQIFSNEINNLFKGRQERSIDPDSLFQLYQNKLSQQTNLEELLINENLSGKIFQKIFRNFIFQNIF